jgi:hypothetical protein
MPGPTSADPIRVRHEHSTSSWANLLYFAVTGGGRNEWIMFERNVRMMHLVTETLMFVGMLVLKEWLRSRAGRQLGR